MVKWLRCVVMTAVLVAVCLSLTGCGLFVESIPKGTMVNQGPYDHFIKVGDTNYHYVEYPGDGEDVLLIHGFASSTYTWEDVVPFLRSKGYHLWAVDMKGFGWSDKPEDSPYDPVSLMEGVHEWLAAVGLQRVVCVGNSLGGAVTVLLALEHPERIDRMTLIDAAGYPMKKPFIIRLSKLPFSGGVMKLTFGRWVVRWNLKEVFYNDNLVTDDRIDAYYNRMRSEHALDAQVSVARSVDFDRFEQYIRRVPDIKAQALLIWGENDQWIPCEVGYRFKKDLADSTITVIPRCGHMPREENPEPTARLIMDFMEGKIIEDSKPRQQE